MAWNYDPAQLGTSTLMQVRFEVGDTDSTDQQLQDEEIAYVLTIENGVIGAAARCCETLARKFARLADHNLGPAGVKASQQFEHYSKLAKELRGKIIAFNAPTAGGIYKSDDLNTDTDVKDSIFSIDMMGDEGRE